MDYTNKNNVFWALLRRDQMLLQNNSGLKKIGPKPRGVFETDSRKSGLMTGFPLINPSALLRFACPAFQCNR
jgi:hypothetical protein